MAEIIEMPRISDTMTEGNIVSWLEVCTPGLIPTPGTPVILISSSSHAADAAVVD